jgi:hypothetical protein
MKILMSLLFITSCTTSYIKYEAIKKSEFIDKNAHNPIYPKELVREKIDSQSVCHGQWLFFHNADRAVQRDIPGLVRMTCPGGEFMLDAQLDETWWTTIIYTQSCAKFTAKCTR